MLCVGVRLRGPDSGEGRAAGWCLGGPSELPPPSRSVRGWGRSFSLPYPAFRNETKRNQMQFLSCTDSGKETAVFVGLFYLSDAFSSVVLFKSPLV